MIWARLNKDTGFLTDIRYGIQQYDDDVPLASMPTERGPWSYDAKTQTAILALSGIKQAKIAAIDARTQELLNAGFTYRPIRSKTVCTFDASDLVRPDWTGLSHAASLGILDAFLPFTIYTLPGDSVSLTTINDVHAFFAAGFGQITVIKQRGAALKEQVKAAATIDDIKAIVDSR